MTHTPGPWRHRSIPGHLFEIRTAPDSEGKENMGDIVFRIRGGMMPTLADATLIALAPEMLALLQECADRINVNRWEADMPILAKVQTLLDRVKG